jgi:hypothetical protein
MASNSSKFNWLFSSLYITPVFKYLLISLLVGFASASLHQVIYTTLDIVPDCRENCII